MARYRKKPVEIEAALFDGALIGEPNGAGKVRLGSSPDWLLAVVKVAGLATEPAEGEVLRCGNTLRIGTREGTMIASPGDYIIRGIAGELYPCKPEIFAQSYKRVAA